MFLFLLHSRYNIFFYNVLQNMNQLDDHKTSQFQINFLEGIHFIYPLPYAKHLLHNVSLPWIIRAFATEKNVLADFQQVTSISQRNVFVFGKTNLSKVYLIERKDIQAKLIQYWINAEESIKIQQNSHIIITLIQPLPKQPIFNPMQLYKRQIIKIKVTILKIPQKQSDIFNFLITLNNSSFVFKPNYCRFNRINEIQVPINRYMRHSSISQETKDGFTLLVNQHNLKQIPFFKGFIQTLLKDNKKVTKIIGHASSIFLQLLINKKGEFDHQGSQILQTYKNKGHQFLQYWKDNNYQHYDYRNTQQLKKNKLKLFQNIVGQIVNQHNLLDQDLVSFVVQNVVNQGFIDNFTYLIRLYYRIFLEQEIEMKEIDQAIMNDFYKGRAANNQMGSPILNFSSFLNKIQFRHSIQNQQLFASFARTISSNRIPADLTLLDLYNYNHVEFTFIAIDLTDSVVRFINRHTTPYMRIQPIVQLTQFLPFPYKSICWLPEWGQYRIVYKNSVKYVDLTNHQLIDSRFLLQCPMDLLLDPNIGECYFGGSKFINKMHAISPSRRKVQEMAQIQQLKTILKRMKSEAIDAIPKLKLIWKILTSKNKVQIDMNKIQTLKQIKILNKLIQIDQSYKHYLENLNKEANKQSIFIKQIQTYSSKILQPEEIINSLNHFAKSIGKLKKRQIHLVAKCKPELQYELHIITNDVNVVDLLSYDEVLDVMQRINKIIRTNSLKDKALVIDIYACIQEQISKNKLFLDTKRIRDLLDKLLETMSKPIRIKRADYFQMKQTIRTLSLDTQHYLTDPEVNLQQNIIKVDESQIYKKIESISDELIKCRERIQSYLSQNRKKQLVFVQYDKCMYKITKKLHELVQNKVINKSLNKFLYQTFQVTPHLYNHQHISKQVYEQQIHDILIDKKDNIGIILPGSKNTLIQQAHLLLSLKGVIKKQNKTLTYINSTNHEAMLSVLFSMNLQDDIFLQQSIAFDFLIKTHKSHVNQDNIDIVNILTNNANPYEFDLDEESPIDHRYAIIKKYQNIFEYITQLQRLYQRNNNLRINEVYELLHEYDLNVSDGDLLFKQMQIIKFIAKLLDEQKQVEKMHDILKQNEKMLKQKIFLNKIGIKFLIRFSYRNAKFQNNWINIHKAKYHSTDLYKKYVINLFERYEIPIGISLREFQEWNDAGLGFIFVLVDVKSNRYELINNENQGQMKMIDLIIAAISSTIQFKPKTIPTQDHQNSIIQQIKHLGKKFHQCFTFKQYWSNNHINSLPFNIIQANPIYKDTSFISLAVLPQRYFNLHRGVINYKQLPHKLKIEQIKCKEQMSKNNIKESDLLSLWWTKPKKLTPELKQLIFNNIYNSSFVKYYQFIQNNSYQHLLQHNNRNIVSLSYNERLDYQKGRIIGHYLNNQTNTLLLKITKSLKQQQTQSIIVQSMLKTDRQKMIILIQDEELRQANQYQKCFSKHDNIVEIKLDYQHQLKLKIYYRGKQQFLCFLVNLELKDQVDREYIEIKIAERQNKRNNKNKNMVEIAVNKVVIDQKSISKIEKAYSHEVEVLRTSSGNDMGQNSVEKSMSKHSFELQDFKTLKSLRILRYSITKDKQVSKLKRGQTKMLVQVVQEQKKEEKLQKKSFLGGLEGCFCFKTKKEPEY